MAKLSTSTVFGDLLVDGTIFGNVTGNLTGNASTATTATTATTANTLTTARTIALGGLLSGSASFNGSGNITINAANAKPPKSGDWWSGGIPIVQTDGVMEIGKYIDFHNSDTSSNDYDIRLQATTAGPIMVNLPSAAGTIARVEDNVASATKLKDARTITIGNKGNSFDGTGNIIYSLADIGAVAIAGDTMTGELILKKGSRVHTAEGTSGTSGYVFIAQIIFSGTYQNQPIYMQIAQRGRDLSTLEMRFSSVNNTDPALSIFNKTGGVEAYLYKSATSTWDLFIKKSEAYDKIDIVDFKKGQYMQYTNIFWANTLYEAVPTGSVAAQSANAGITAVNSNFSNATITNYDTVMAGINTNIGKL